MLLLLVHVLLSMSVDWVFIKHCLSMRGHHSDCNSQAGRSRHSHPHCVGGAADEKKALFLLHVDANSVSLGADTATFLLPGSRCTPLPCVSRMLLLISIHLGMIPAESVAMACKKAPVLSSRFR